VEVSSAINTNVNGLFEALMDSLIPQSTDEEEWEEEDGIVDFHEVPQFDLIEETKENIKSLGADTIK
jgi:hypothetical protein